MNYYGCICTFLRSCGIDHKNLVAKEHRPHKEDPEPEAYSKDEMERFLAACGSDRDRLFFQFLLKTGAREKEATHAEWTDINWSENVITIQGEKNVKVRVDGKERTIRFRTKTRRSRDITLEASLLESLKAWRAKHRSTRFIFGTSSDLPNGHFLETCKEVASRAGGLPALQAKFPEIVRDAVDFVLDPVRTARTKVTDLDNVEKTFIGLKLEHFVRDRPDARLLHRELIGLLNLGENLRLAQNHAIQTGGDAEQMPHGAFAPLLEHIVEHGALARWRGSLTHGGPPRNRSANREVPEGFPPSGCNGGRLPDRGGGP
jgi:hypothetical protein